MQIFTQQNRVKKNKYNFLFKTCQYLKINISIVYGSEFHAKKLQKKYQNDEK